LFIPTLTSAADVEGLDVDAVIEAMRHDKKRSGPGLAVVLPLEDWSLALQDDVSASEALHALAELPRALQTATNLRDRLARSHGV
jgi:3-dehydroquinate synthetase